jgi:hypothetical protein
MQHEDAVAFAAAAWLVSAAVLVIRSVRQGRALSDALAARHPETFEELGRPRPGYFDSVRRDCFARFVMRRGYRELDDPPLVDEFERHRRSEVQLLIVLLSGLAVVSLLILWLKRAA